MTAEQFCFWLQGAFEMNDFETTGLTPSQASTVKNHLNLAFIHDIDPKAGDAAHQQVLNETHNGLTTKPPFNNLPVMRC